MSPYLVLPVLSAQGAAESMGQDAEKGTSAGQAVGVGLAKFGAGWAINSVGVADMARSMGVDYARDTVAGKLADLVRSSKLVSRLGNSQLAANTISGGVDNAVQAFVETYADKIIVPRWAATSRPPTSCYRATPFCRHCRPVPLAVRPVRWAVPWARGWAP